MRTHLFKGAEQSNEEIAGLFLLIYCISRTAHQESACAVFEAEPNLGWCLRDVGAPLRFLGIRKKKSSEKYCCTSFEFQFNQMETWHFLTVYLKRLRLGVIWEKMRRKKSTVFFWSRLFRTGE
jgi:hypothetical protein